jgi:hypothetical protein
MPHNVFVRDDGGGIYSRPVPENFLNFGAFGYALTPANFVRCLLASLAASSTAARSSNVVTVTATAHGVPNTYNGFRFYYPGSASLAAGWVDNITVVDANTITFPSTGTNFGSESVNSAAAYTTATNIPSSILIPAGMVADSTHMRMIANTASLNTGATKTIRPYSLTAAGFIATAQTGTTFPCQSREWDLAMLNSTQISGQNTNPGSSSLASVITFNPLVDNLITIQLTVSAASDFVALIAHPKIVLYR